MRSGGDSLYWYRLAMTAKITANMPINPAKTKNSSACHGNMRKKNMPLTTPVKTNFSKKKTHYNPFHQIDANNSIQKSSTRSKLTTNHSSLYNTWLGMRCAPLKIITCGQMTKDLYIYIKTTEATPIEATKATPTEATPAEATHKPLKPHTSHRSHAHWSHWSPTHWGHTRWSHWSHWSHWLIIFKIFIAVILRIRFTSSHCCENDEVMEQMQHLQ